MTPEEVTQAYQAIAAQLPQQVNQQVQTVAQNTAATAPGVAATGGGSATSIGDYNQARLISPNVTALSDQLVLQGRDQAFRLGTAQELVAAQERYEQAKAAYSARQRAAYAAAAAASSAGGGSDDEIAPGAVAGVDLQASEGITGSANPQQTAQGTILQGTSPNLQSAPVLIQGSNANPQRAQITVQGAQPSRGVVISSGGPINPNGKTIVIR